MAYQFRLSDPIFIDIPLTSNAVVYFNATLIQHRQCELVAGKGGARHFNYATYANKKWFDFTACTIARYNEAAKDSRRARRKRNKLLRKEEWDNGSD